MITTSIDEFLNSLDLDGFCGVVYDKVEATEQEKNSNVVTLRRDELGYTIHVFNPHKLRLHPPGTHERWKFSIPNTQFVANTIYHGLPSQRKNKLLELSDLHTAYMISGNDEIIRLEQFLDHQQALFHETYFHAPTYNVLVRAVPAAGHVALTLAREQNLPARLDDKIHLLSHEYFDTTMKEATHITHDILRRNGVAYRHEGINEAPTAVNTIRLYGEREVVDLFEALQSIQRDLTQVLKPKY